MALVLGTNCGFVTIAPVDDPAEGNVTRVDNSSTANKDTAPIGAIKVVEIGWWCANATQETNFEVGIYSHDVGNDKPNTKVGDFSITNAKGTDAGWKRVTRLNIPITAETIYWIAIQVDTTVSRTDLDWNDGIGRRSFVTPSSTLADTWGIGSDEGTTYRAIYAVWEAIPRHGFVNFQDPGIV